MATCVVSGVIKDPSETAISSVTVSAVPLNPYFTTTIQIVPKLISTTTDATGAWSLTLGRTGQFTVSVMYPPNNVDSARKYTYTITVPDQATADFSTLATEL